jgi:hypothetical protein
MGLCQRRVANLASYISECECSDQRPERARVIIRENVEWASRTGSFAPEGLPLQGGSYQERRKGSVWV